MLRSAFFFSLLIAAPLATSCSANDPGQPESSNASGLGSEFGSTGDATGDAAGGSTSGTSATSATPGAAGGTSSTSSSGAVASTSSGGSTEQASVGQGGSVDLQSTTTSPSAGAGGTGSSDVVISVGAGGMANVAGALNIAGAMNASGAMNEGGGVNGASAGAANGGGSPMGGAGGVGGAATGGAAGDDEDLLPSRPLDVTASEGRHEHNFRASDADPDVSFNDNTQIAVFDNRAATLMGKLVLTFGGAGQTKGNLTGAGEFCARRGFHVLAVAAFQDYDIVSYGADFFGDARRTAFEGTMYTHEDAFANIEMTPADGVAQRTQKGLQYLHAMYPGEDWGYYLQEDGSVRWSDVIFTGMSHGASSSARFAFLVRASRVVSSAGPRDNLCERVNLDNCGGVVATWFDEVAATPIDRFYAITGTGDSQHTQHLFAMEKLGYVGEPTNIDGAQPPYGESHRLVANAGHDDFCGQGAYENACNYVFGVPPENQAGTGP